MKKPVRDLSVLSRGLDHSIEGCSLAVGKEIHLRAGDGLEIVRREFRNDIVRGHERFLQEIRAWLGQVSRVDVAEFQITSIEEIASAPLAVRLEIRYDIVVERNGHAT